MAVPPKPPIKCMNNNYHISIESLRITGLGELFAALERGFGSVGVDFYVVGAFARDIRERRAIRTLT